MKDRNRRVFLVLSIIVLIFCVAAPKLIGLGVKDIVQNTILETFPDTTQAQISIGEIQFESDWFQSTVITDITLTSFDLDEPINIRLNFDIRHGPFLFTEDGPKFGLAHIRIVANSDIPGASLSFTQAPLEQHPILVTALISFDQSLEVNFDVPPISLTQNGIMAKFTGMEGKLKAYSNQSVHLNILVGDIIIQESISQFEFNLVGIEIESYTEQLNNLLAPSTLLLTIPEISSSSPFEFRATNLFSNSMVRASSVPQAIDMYQNLKLDSIESDLPIQSLNWTTELNEVKNDLFKGYYKLISKIRPNANFDINAIIEAANQFEEEISSVLIKNSLEFNNFIEANVFGGDHSLEFSLHWEGILDHDNLENLVFEEIVNALTVRVEVSLNEEAIMTSEFAVLIDAYVQQEFFRVENGQILLGVEMKNNTLTVNEEMVPLDQFF